MFGASGLVPDLALVASRRTVSPQLRPITRHQTRLRGRAPPRSVRLRPCKLAGGVGRATLCSLGERSEAGQCLNTTDASPYPFHELANWLSNRYPLTEAVRYTGAGVRVRDGPALDAVVARAAAVVALVASFRKCVLGLMITASHNPSSENGVKVVRSDGGLLQAHLQDTPHPLLGEFFADLLQETLAPPTDSANNGSFDGMNVETLTVPIHAPSAVALGSLFHRLAHRMLHGREPAAAEKTATLPGAAGSSIDDKSGRGGVVILGYDNRPSSARLAQVALEVLVRATQCSGVRNLGLTTTPFTQYAVWASQNGRLSTFDAYVHERLVKGYHALCRALQRDPEVTGSGAVDSTTRLRVDCAYGSASVVLAEVSSLLSFPLSTTHRHEESQAVNERCGAEYIHQHAGHGDDFRCLVSGDRMAALDGDADRMVYYASSEQRSAGRTKEASSISSIVVYDGDWIALCLVAFLRRCVQLLVAAPETTTTPIQVLPRLSFGCALTAYCRRVYRERIRALCDGNLVLVPTGAQYGRDIVERCFNLAVYAEPNGHVGCYVAPLVQRQLYELLLRDVSTPLTREARYAAECIVSLARLANPAGSDGVATLLTMEALLRTEPVTHLLERLEVFASAGHSEVVNAQLTEHDMETPLLRQASRYAAANWRYTADETRVLDPEWVQTALIDEQLQRIQLEFPDVSIEDAVSVLVRPSRTQPFWRIRVEVSSTALEGEVAKTLARRLERLLRSRLRQILEQVATSLSENELRHLESGSFGIRLAETSRLGDLEVAGALLAEADAGELGPASAWQAQLQSAAVVGIVLAAGRGTRFRAAYPKVVHSFCGKPMLRHVVETLHTMGIPTVVVGNESVEGAIRTALDALPYLLVRQSQPLGTGHALYAALCSTLSTFSGDILVLYGDNPGVDSAILEPLLDQRSRQREAAAHPNGPSQTFGVILSGCYTSRDAGAYGRVVRDAQSGALRAIVEYREALQRPDGAQILAIREFYSGIMVVDRALSMQLLAASLPHRVDKGNQRVRSSSPVPERFEYYATDLVQMAVDCGYDVDVYCVREESGLLWRLEGVNTVAELEALEQMASSPPRGNNGAAMPPTRTHS